MRDWWEGLNKTTRGLVLIVLGLSIVTCSLAVGAEPRISDGPDVTGKAIEHMMMPLSVIVDDGAPFSTGCGAIGEAFVRRADFPMVQGTVYSTELTMTAASGGEEQCLTGVQYDTGMEIRYLGASAPTCGSQERLDEAIFPGERVLLTPRSDLCMDPQGGTCGITIFFEVIGPNTIENYAWLLSECQFGIDKLVAAVGMDIEIERGEAPSVSRDRTISVGRSGKAVEVER